MTEGRNEGGMDFILASSNQGKVKEILDLFGEAHRVQTLKDIGYTDEIIEDGKTFEENALIKAKAIYNWVPGGRVIIADDSGLEIDALDGKPGVYSARWLGADTPYDIKNLQVLEMLDAVPEDKRGARFVSAIACILPDGEVKTARGTLEGRIASEARGHGGFGYDPIFYVPELGKNLAELSREEKNRISHRAKALTRIRDLLEV